MTPRNRTAAALLLVAAAIAAGQANTTGPAGKIHVLIVEDYHARGKLPKEQAAVFSSKAVRTYLDTHCADRRGIPDRRILDQRADLSQEDADWQAMMSRPRKSLPWITIAAGRRTYDGPLPGSPEATLDLLKKYGGP